MTREELKGILPHREPMLLLDEASAGEDGLARGVYTVRGDEWFLRGHFPGNPIVPGVIQCEMAAQTCAVLLGSRMEGYTPLYTSIDRARFRRIVRPGDTIVFTVKLTRERPPFYFASASAEVNGEVCMTAELSFSVS